MDSLILYKVQIRQYGTKSIERKSKTHPARRQAWGFETPCRWGAGRDPMRSDEFRLFVERSARKFNPRLTLRTDAGSAKFEAVTGGLNCELIGSLRLGLERTKSKLRG